MHEQPGDVVGIARCTRGIDREGHHLVVDAIEEEMKGLGAQSFGFEPDASWIARSRAVISTSSISPIGSANRRSV